MKRRAPSVLAGTVAAGCAATRGKGPAAAATPGPAGSAPTRPTAALATGSTAGQIMASDGAPIEYYTHGDPRSPALIISPAFTGSAKLYADSFGQALPGYYVVAVQLRGHGHGGGCEYEGRRYCTNRQPPDEGLYYGFRMPRLAMDIRDVRQALGLKKAAFMGHSLGVNAILEYISDQGTDGISGFFILDQSPVNLAAAPRSDAGFPASLATYPMEKFINLSSSIAQWDPVKGYVNVPKGMLEMLGGPANNPVYNPAKPAPTFVLTQEAWDIWAPFANAMNGKVVSLAFWSSITQDYTDVYRTIARSRIPVLVFGGKMSIVPWTAMQWVHDQIPGSEFMLFDEKVGVHTPFLNPPPSGSQFMDTFRRFLDRSVKPRAS
jgi:non-heme chloroperoxidase